MGFTIGASIATLDRETTLAGGDPFSSRTGATAGAYALLPLHERFGVRFEMLFTQKGASVPLHDPTVSQGSLTTRYQFHYMDLPVFAQFRGPRIKAALLHAFAGPTFSVRVGAERQTVFGGSSGFERDLGDEMERFDSALTFGGGLQVSRVSFDVRYSHGLNGVLDDDNGTSLSNRGLLVTTAVKIF